MSLEQALKETERLRKENALPQGEGGVGVEQAERRGRVYVSPGGQGPFLHHHPASVVSIKCACVFRLRIFSSFSFFLILFKDFY